MCLSQRRDEQKKEIPQSTAQHSTHSHKMAKLLLLFVVGIAALAAAQAQQLQQLQRLISEEQSKCASGQDSMACIKERAMRFVDNVLSKDSYTVSNNSSSRERAVQSLMMMLIPSILSYRYSCPTWRCTRTGNRWRL